MNRTALALRGPRRALRRPLRPAGPFLKWAGGKTALLGELAARAPRSFVRYHEPFLGGGALFFRTAPRAAVLSDANEELIGTYRAVQRDAEAVIEVLEGHRRRHSEEYYYQMRKGWNEKDEPIGSPERAGAFIYLNKTCYNGLWRVNSRGLFNVPVGRYKSPAILDAENLRAASRALRRATLRHAPFESVLEEARAGDFVYFDPPYVPTSPTAHFTSYTADSFSLYDQERLADVFRELASRGCAVMLSNSDTALVHELYTGFRIDRVFSPRAINSKATHRGQTPELIIRNNY